MGWYLTVEPVDFSFSHLSPTEFDALVAKVKAIPDIEAEYDVGELKVNKRSRTIRYAGSFRGGGESVLMPFFELVAQNLRGRDDAPPYYVCTYSDQAEASYLQEDSEAIRYIVGSGYVAEQRMYVSLPYGEYTLYRSTPAEDESHESWGSADIKRYHERMRDRLERSEGLESVGQTQGPTDERSFEAELLAIPTGETPRWDDGTAFIEQLAETPRSRWKTRSDVDVPPDSDTEAIIGFLKRAVSTLRREWENREQKPRHFSIIHDVGGRDVMVTGAWLETSGRRPISSSSNDEVRLLEWSGVSNALGFVDD